MYIDWFTWSIWLVGFIIMIVWITVPIKEFKKLLEQKKSNKIDKP